MSSKRYTGEFKIEAVRQVSDRGFKVAEVAERLGVTTRSVFAWLRKFGKPGALTVGRVSTCRLSLTEAGHRFYAQSRYQSVHIQISSTPVSAPAR